MEMDPQNDKASSCESKGTLSVFEREATQAFLSEAVASRQEMVQSLTANFTKHDGDKDGFLSFDELSSLASSKINKLEFDKTYESAQIALNYINDIEGLSNDEWGIENNGITRDDLKSLGQLDKDEYASKQVEASIDAYEKVTIDDFRTVGAIRRNLEEGNPVPLAVAMDLLPYHEQRVGMLHTMERIGTQNPKAPVPILDIDVRMPSDSCILSMEVKRPETFTEGALEVLLYEEGYGSHYGTRYSPNWQMYQKE